MFSSNIIGCTQRLDYIYSNKHYLYIYIYFISFDFIISTCDKVTKWFIDTKYTNTLYLKLHTKYVIKPYDNINFKTLLSSYFFYSHIYIYIFNISNTNPILNYLSKQPVLYILYTFTQLFLKTWPISYSTWDRLEHWKWECV